MPDRGKRAYQPFATTRWTMVFRAAKEDPEGAREELGALLSRYLPALRSYLLLWKRVPRDKVDDILQDFVSVKILQQNLVALADPKRGRFRNLLLKALNNHVAATVRHDKAKKRSPDGPILDVDEYPHAVPSEAPTTAFDVEWGREVLRETVRRTQAECERSGRPDIWGVFEDRLLRPTLEQDKPPPYKEIVKRYGLQSPAQASNVLITAKRMFARVMRSVVAEYAREEMEIEAEIRDLREILSHADAGSGAFDAQ